MGQVSWMKNLILAAVLLTIGGVVLWIEFSHNPKVELAEEQSKKVFLLKDIQIKKIRLVDGVKAFSFECLDLQEKLCKPGDHSNWKIESPTSLGADKSNLNALLSSINNIAANEIVDLKQESPEQRQALLNDYGLAEDLRNQDAFRRVELETGEGKILKAFFGGVHPIGNKIFVATSIDGQVDDSRVLLIPSYFKSNFEHDLTYWRDKKLVDVAAHDVSGFDFESAKAQVSAEKVDGKWQLALGTQGKEGQVPANSENITNLMNAVAQLSAKDFPAENKDSSEAKRVLRGAKKILTLSLKIQDSTPVVQGEEAAKEKAKTRSVKVELFEKLKDGKTDQLYASVSDQTPLFELTSATKARLDKSLKDFRMTKLISSLERYSISRLKVNDRVLTKKDNQWTASDLALDEAKVKRFLDQLSGNRIQEFIEGRRIPRGENEGVQIVLGDEENPEKTKILFWKSKSEVYARDLLSSRKEAFKIDPTLENSIPWTIDSFNQTSSPSPTEGSPENVPSDSSTSLQVQPSSKASG